MAFSTELIQELNVLMHFKNTTLQNGIKVHEHEASPEICAAAERLFDKGLISQKDGGYLTELGREAVEHLLGALTLLTPRHD